MKTASQIAAALAVASGLFCAASARADVLLLSDDFSDGNYTSNPAWTVTQGTWSVSDAAVHTGGTSAFAFLRTTDFTKITNGAFTLSVDVSFESLTVTGDNRLYLRMRDSASSSAGYEIAIAQGTMSNSGFTALGGATMGTQTKTNSPQTFALDTFINITWERLATGAMTVHVNNNLYLSVASSSLATYDTLEIGGRVYFSPSTAYNYSFTNVELSTVPEPGSVGLLLGVGGAFLMVSRRRRRAAHAGV